MNGAANTYPAPISGNGRGPGYVDNQDINSNCSINSRKCEISYLKSWLVELHETSEMNPNGRAEYSPKKAVYEAATTLETRNVVGL